LGAKPPPQFGQTFPITSSTHVAQNVHSNEHMRASVESGGSALVQCSQTGRNASATRTSKSSSLMPYLRWISCLDISSGIPSIRLHEQIVYESTRTARTCCLNSSGVNGF